MKVKIALAALACSGTLLALLPTLASAAPVSGIGQSRSVAPRRTIHCSGKCIAGGAGVGDGVVPITGTVTDTGMDMATLTIGPTIPPIGLTITATTRPITHATTRRRTIMRVRTILMATDIILPPLSERCPGAEERGRD